MQRRTVLAGFCASALSARPGFAETTVDLKWEDLVPADHPIPSPRTLPSSVRHDQPPLANQQPKSYGVRTDWNGQIISLPGFIVPIEYSGTGVSVFILVPYAGACVHVPPPPANQLVFVTTQTPYPSAGLYEPVLVTGMFGTAATSTQLADISYALSADRIEPFRG